MKIRLKQAISILLCTFFALSLIQAAGATEISVAPLNPDLNTSFGEVLTTPKETVWTDNESQSSDGDEWNNLTNTSPDTYVCITAFTSNTLRVPSDNYSSIQSAVNAAIAGDTVIVESGTYNENVAITTAITLRGIDTGDGFPVIDACGNGSALSVTADNVTVEGFELTGGGEENMDAGLYVRADNTNLININAHQNTGDGIDLCYSQGCTLTNCSANDNGWGGMYLYKSPDSTLTNCSANGNGNEMYGYGIILYFSPNSTLNDCSANGNDNGMHGYGIFLNYSPDSTLNNCSANGNGNGMHGYGIILDNSPDSTLNDCSANGNGNGMYGYGIFLNYSPDSTLSNCSANENGQNGINLYASPGSSLNGCVADDNEQYGIRIDHCNSVYEAGTDTMALSYHSDDIRHPTGTDAAGMNDGPLFSTSSRIPSDNRWEDMQEMSIPGERERDAHARSGHADVNRSGCQADASDREGSIYDTSPVMLNSYRVADNSDDGIKFTSLKKCVLTNNSMEGNRYNFGINGWDENEFIHSIDTSNTVNGKPVYYLIDATGNPEGGFADAGVIYAINCTGLDIHDLTLSNNEYGIYFRNTTFSSITDVTTSENICGIYLDLSSNNTIDNCKATENEEGILLGFSSNNSITRCEATENERGILLIESSNNSITRCETTENNRGILLFESSNNSISSCEARENHCGIDLYGSCNNSIDRCKATENYFGIYLERSADNNSITSCKATKNERGIYLSGSENNNIDHCEATENIRYGINLVMSSDNNRITRCEATENDYGIYLYKSENNSIDRCEATENEWGIYLWGSEHCTLTENTMDKNQYNFDVDGEEDAQFIHSIDTSNTVDGKTAYYILNATANPEGDFVDAGTIYAVNCIGLDIRDLTLSNNGCGIYFWNTTSSTITDVMATENDYGILLEESSNNTIVNCRASENGYLGIYLWNSEHCTLTGNAMDSNQYNFGVDGWEDASYVHFIDTSNTVNGKPVYYLLNATANPEGNFTDAGTIYAVNCTGLDIHDLTISNGYSGICIRNCSGLDIHDLTISDNAWGIELRFNTNITLDTITATENYYGIYTNCCSDSMIMGVNARNSEIGIYSYNSENIHISDCTVQNNNNDGITVYFARYCTVSNCTTSNNSGNGFSIWYSENSILSLNSFINNTVYERNSEDTLWNTPHPLTYRYGEQMLKKTSLMGNYWGAAYNGTDRNGDGIGDTPFTGTDFTDTYPLMESPSAYTFVENTGSDDDDTGDHDVEAAGNLKAGDSVDLQFRGTAVTGVTIRAAENIDLMTLRMAPASGGPEGLNGQVYQYLEADLIYATDDEIAGADFTFTVPTAWLQANGLTPADIVLWRFHDGVWVSLPTKIISEEGDPIVYGAVSPGFSYFAIGEREAVAEQPVETTPTPAPVSESTAESTVPSAATGEAAAATATPPQKSPAGLCTILAAFGTAGLLFRRH